MRYMRLKCDDRELFIPITEKTKFVLKTTQKRLFIGIIDDDLMFTGNHLCNNPKELLDNFQNILCTERSIDFDDINFKLLEDEKDE